MRGVGREKNETEELISANRDASKYTHPPSKNLCLFPNLRDNALHPCSHSSSKDWREDLHSSHFLQQNVSQLVQGTKYRRGQASPIPWSTMVCYVDWTRAHRQCHTHHSITFHMSIILDLLCCLWPHKAKLGKFHRNS